MGLPFNDGGFTSVATDCASCNDWKRNHIKLQRSDGTVFVCPSNGVITLYRENDERMWRTKLTEEEQRIVDRELSK